MKAWIVLLALALLPQAFAEAGSAAMAASPPACAPNEAPVVCNIVVQRNSAMDSLALALADKTALQIRIDAARTQAQAKSYYWRRYVRGIAALDRRLIATQAFWRKYVSELSRKVVRARRDDHRTTRGSLVSITGTSSLHGHGPAPRPIGRNGRNDLNGARRTDR
jgi:hypothetical protein